MGSLYEVNGTTGATAQATTINSGSVVTINFAGANNVSPIAICIGPDNNVWATLQSTNQIAKIAVTGITLYTIPTPNSGPSGICAGPDGNIWFTEIFANKVAKVTTSGTFTEYSVTSNPAFGNNYSPIIAGPDGNLWFTEYTAVKLGKITTSGTLTEYPVPPPGNIYGTQAPTGICVGPDNLIWIAVASSAVGKTTTSGSFTMYTVPGGQHFPSQICAGPDGNLWFTEYDFARIGNVNTTGSTFNSYGPPSGPNCAPFGITAGPDGNLWFTETDEFNSGANPKIATITTGGTFNEFLTLSANSNPLVIITGPDNNMWWVNSGNGTQGTVDKYFLQSAKGPAASIQANPLAAFQYTLKLPTQLSSGYLLSDSLGNTSLSNLMSFDGGDIFSDGFGDIYTGPFDPNTGVVTSGSIITGSVEAPFISIADPATGNSAFFTTPGLTNSPSLNILDWGTAVSSTNVVLSVYDSGGQFSGTISGHDMLNGAVPATGMYRASIWAASQPGGGASGSSTFTLHWTDELSRVQSATIGSVNLAVASFTSNSFYLSVLGGSNITISASGGSFGTGTAIFHGNVERLQ